MSDKSKNVVAFTNDAIKKIKNCKPIKLAGVYSHLAATDDLNETKFTNSQINLFKKLSSKHR